MLAGDRQRLFLLRRQDELELIASGRGGDRALGQLPLEESVLTAVRRRLEDAAVPAWLLLPSATVLRRSLSLPLAAEPRLREVLAFELDRQTPFSADQVSHQGRVLSRDPATQQMQVELLVLPRARLDAELQAIGALAQGLAGVDAIEADGRRLGRPWSVAGARAGAPDRRRTAIRHHGRATPRASIARRRAMTTRRVHARHLHHHANAGLGEHQRSRETGSPAYA